MTPEQPTLTPIIKNLMYAASICVTQEKAMDAILLYDKVISLMPNYAQAYYERGRVRHMIGDVNGASEDLKHAFLLSPELEKEISGQFQAGISKCK